MWPSTGKPGTTRHPSKNFFLHLQSCWRPDIELSKFYRHSLSRSHYNRPNRSLPSAWNNTFLRNRSIFSRYLRTPRCAWFSCRRSQMRVLFLFSLAPEFFLELQQYVLLLTLKLHSLPLWVILVLDWNHSHLKGSKEKLRQNVKKTSVITRESEPGPLALATSALATELRQPTTSKTLTFYLYTVE